jgi:chitin synthase
MSAGYALVMMAVIVGTALQLGEDGIGSPSAIFLIALSGSFFIAACLHPQEFWCIVPGMLYLLLIPSMYLLLIIYGLVNLNNVSWGTREVLTKKTKAVSEQTMSARLTFHSTKLRKKFKIFRKNIFFGTRITSEAFLSISQHLKVTRLQGGTQAKL